MRGSGPPLPAPGRRRASGKKGRGASRTLAVVPARPGDHPAALRFLVSVFRGPSPAEFRASLDDPKHEPHDRLLLKRGHDILGHALVTHRCVRLGQSVVSAACVHGLAVAPDLRGRGFGSLLLRRAERHMIAEGHSVGLLATANPEFFARFGWVVCGTRNQLRANVCRILSVLAAKGLYPGIRKPLDIRPLRRMEIPAVAELYQTAVCGSYGPLERSEAFWQWLVGRRAYDEFLVAIDRRGTRRRLSAEAALVGYAILKRDRIVELFTSPNHSGACVQLLSRACGDAIEHSVDTLQINLAPKHPLRRVLRAAGASHSRRDSRRGEVLMAKVLCPDQMLQRLSSELTERAVAGGLPLPLEFGLAADPQKYQLSIDSDSTEIGNGHPRRSCSVRVTIGSIGRSYLRTDPAQLTGLLLGQIDWNSPCNIELSTNVAEQAARTLFPRQTLWRPLFDDLPAEGR